MRASESGWVRSRGAVGGLARILWLGGKAVRHGGAQHLVSPMNPVLARIESLVAEGLPVSAVRVELRGRGRWRAFISIPAYLQLGEGDGSCGPGYSVEIAPPPPGVTLQGWERYPDQTVEFDGSEEVAEAVVREVATVGAADDWARFDGGGESYPHFVTKPNRWYRAGSLGTAR